MKNPTREVSKALVLGLAIGIAGLALVAQAAAQETAGSQPGQTGPQVKITFTTLGDAEKIAADRPTVLFFFATWCPTCQAAMRDINAHLGAFGDVALVIVDYDRERALKRRYGVTYQHTFVQIDAAGESIAKWNGGGVDDILGHVVIE